ncbi:MAG TPA: TldD/PmbA family protein [Acidimicrobiales bacterium]|nr:TldD/PmbA family protein [Acidimicrobiales bacterium]
MLDLATVAVEAALAAGARYADARVMVVRHESMSARNRVVEELTQGEQAGIGVRALIGSSWGFQATPTLTDAAARLAGAAAAAVAKASALVPGPPLELAPAPVVTDSWTSSWSEHPLDDVSLAEKGDLLLAATGAANDAGVPLSQASYRVWDTEKWFASSEGSRIEQRIVETGALVDATAIGDGETQRRSYPGVRGQYGTRGWELVRGLDLVANAARAGAEAAALLSAPRCPPGTTTIVLGSDQVALQIHESVGHAVELDRILGWEAAFAGTSWLDPARLGDMRFGSELMRITADATLPGAMGSFGYDDEGVSAQAVDIVRDGTWVGVLSGRDSAPLVGQASGGMVRADGPARLPMVRMTNVGLLPGDSSLEEMIAGTERGIYMTTNRSWSIDDKRLNFQFGCEIGWEIVAGELGRMVKDPTYTGIGPRFWASLDAVGGEDEWEVWGLPNCGKGQPLQVGHTGHHAAPCRFRDVRVGVR